MKAVFLFLFTFFLVYPSIAQDTLYLANSFNFGVSQTYVLHGNQHFEFTSRCQCTGSTIKGEGTFQNKGHKISFTFDTFALPINSANCINSVPSDSISLFVYDVVDSSQFDFFSVKDTAAHWLNSINNKIGWHDLSFEVFWIYTDFIEIQPDSTCFAYEIYLAPRFDTILKGTEHILKKNKDGYKRVQVYKPKHSDKRKYKNVYSYRFNSK